MRIGRLGLAFCALVAGVGVGTLRPPESPVAIGQGIQVLSGRAGAVRATEVVRYDDTDLTLAASFTVVAGELQSNGAAAHDPQPVGTRSRTCCRPTRCHGSAS